MFKKASDNLSYLERTGSHATKPSPTGRVDMLPSWAQEPETYYNSLLGRYRSLCAQRDQCQEQLEALNLRLKTTLPRKEYDHAMEVKRALMPRYSILQQEISQYRMMVREASLKSWATTFFYCAKLKLDRDVFVGLCIDTREMLGRMQWEIKGGRAESSPETRLAEARKDRRGRFRKTLKGRLATAAEQVVYSDESIPRRP